MEHVDGLHLLARTHKLDGLGDDGTDGQGSTTAGVTVELGQHHAVEVQTVVELLGGVHGVLTGHRVDHEERLIGVDGLLQPTDLVHHLLVDGQTTGGIDDDHVVRLLLGLADSVLGNLHHVLVAFLDVDVAAYRLTNHLQLLDGSRTVDVAGHQQRILVLARLQHVGQLAAERRLTRTLQTRHQDDGRAVLQLQLHGLAAHQLGQLVVHNLHHQLAGLHGSEHVHTHRLLLHGIRERLCHLVVHVGIKQCTTHVFQGFSYVDLGDLSLTFQYLERSLKSVT